MGANNKPHKHSHPSSYYQDVCLKKLSREMKANLCQTAHTFVIPAQRHLPAVLTLHSKTKPHKHSHTSPRLSKNSLERERE